TPEKHRRPCTQRLEPRIVRPVAHDDQFPPEPSASLDSEVNPLVGHQPRDAEVEILWLRGHTVIRKPYRRMDDSCHNSVARQDRVSHVTARGGDSTDPARGAGIDR